MMNNKVSKHLLRIEGVNLSSVLDDTSEISIHRGAGLMLRQAVVDLTLERQKLEAISTGASAGLFLFSSEQPEAVVEEAAQWLNNNYPWFTFVVDSSPLDLGFKAAHRAVIQKNRMRQFQQITFVPPTQGESTECCSMTQLHSTDGKTQRKEQQVSASAAARFDYGRDKRNQFYENELKKEMPFQFTNELEELAAPSAGQNFGNLNDKMAVIYLDGNKFSEIQRSCETVEQLIAFDRCVQSYRRSFLDSLTQRLARDKDFLNRDRIRMETLLWGGDEMILVVPAWKGMEVLQFFYECSVDWAFDGEPLTHAGGIVFCHHKIPIAQLKKCAEALANRVKKATPKQNGFDYMVLESVGYPTQELNLFWNNHYGQNVRQQCPPLKPFVQKEGLPWHERLSRLNEALEQLPKGPLYEIAQCWIKCKNEPAESPNLEKRINRFIKVSPNAHDSLFKYLFGYFSENPSTTVAEQHNNPGWLHLIELWDYLVPMNSKKEGAAQ